MCSAEKLIEEDDPYDPHLLIEFFQADFYPSFLRLNLKNNQVFLIIWAILKKWILDVEVLNPLTRNFFKLKPKNQGYQEKEKLKDGEDMDLRDDIL